MVAQTINNAHIESENFLKLFLITINNELDFMGINYIQTNGQPCKGITAKGETDGRNQWQYF